MITPAELKAGINTIKVMADAVKELGHVPSGHLYAMVMGKLSLEAYERILGILTNAGLIEVKGNEIFWIMEAGK